jgi:hypothetical protein
VIGVADGRSEQRLAIEIVQPVFPHLVALTTPSPSSLQAVTANPAGAQVSS